MATRLGMLVLCVALTLGSGCAHHRVGRPPTAREIAEINEESSAGGTAMTVYYVDQEHPCGAGACAVDGPRPDSNTPPFEIERIVGVDEQRMTVVAKSGDVWQLDLTQLAGVTTHGHATWQGSVVGGSLGLVLGGLVALYASDPAAGILGDPPVMSSGQSSSGTTAVEILVGFTVVGAIIGAIAGYNAHTNDTYEFGNTGLSFGPPSSFSR
jgi:hypothetical protein